MLVAGKQIKRRAFQSSSAQATSLSRESKNLRLKKNQNRTLWWSSDQLRLCLCTSVSHQAPSSTVRIPHICVLLVCAFFTTPPPCVCQHNLWHCHITVCATIKSQTKVFGRDPTPSYRGGSAIRQQTRQESFCTLSIENRFKSASSQEHFSPRSCSWVGHGGSSRVLWVRACKEPLMGHLRYSLPSQEPRMRSLRSIRVPLVTVLSGPVCPRGFRKALVYERCLCFCVCACECICVCVFVHPNVCMMGASECVVCVPSCRLTLSHSVELPRESFRGHIPASLKRNYPAIWW